MDDKLDTWCPECGPDVKLDEDLCCAGCGATATGDGVIMAVHALRQVTSIRKYIQHLRGVVKKQNGRFYPRDSVSAILPAELIADALENHLENPK